MVNHFSCISSKSACSIILLEIILDFETYVSKPSLAISSTLSTKSIRNETFGFQALHTVVSLNILFFFKIWQLMDKK